MTIFHSRCCHRVLIENEFFWDECHAVCQLRQTKTKRNVMAVCDKCHRALYYAKLARHSLGASSSGRTEICKTPAEMTCVVSSTATLNIFHTSGARQVVAIISIPPIISIPANKHLGSSEKALHLSLANAVSIRF